MARDPSSPSTLHRRTLVKIQLTEWFLEFGAYRSCEGMVCFTGQNTGFNSTCAVCLPNPTKEINFLFLKAKTGVIALFLQEALWEDPLRQRGWNQRRRRLRLRLNQSGRFAQEDAAKNPIEPKAPRALPAIEVVPEFFLDAFPAFRKFGGCFLRFAVVITSHR